MINEETLKAVDQLLMEYVTGIREVALRDGQCKYLLEGGARCALSSMLDETCTQFNVIVTQHNNRSGSELQAEGVITKSTFKDPFKPLYCEEDLVQCIQDFHDTLYRGLVEAESRLSDLRSVGKYHFPLITKALEENFNPKMAEISEVGGD